MGKERQASRQVDSHWGRIFSGALLTSLFAAGIEISQGQNSSVLTQPSYGQQIGQAVGQQVGQVGVEVTRENVNIRPEDHRQAGIQVLREG